MSWWTKETTDVISFTKLVNCSYYDVRRFYYFVCLLYTASSIIYKIWNFKEEKQKGKCCHTTKYSASNRVPLAKAKRYTLIPAAIAQLNWRKGNINLHILLKTGSILFINCVLNLWKKLFLKTILYLHDVFMCCVSLLHNQLASGDKSSDWFIQVLSDTNMGRKMEQDPFFSVSETPSMMPYALCTAIT